MALCLCVHWLDFRAWFRADDFAWFGLAPGVHSFHELARALFSPRAQGTIRPLSERAFFLAGYYLFGLHSLPYRMVIFGTQFADLALILAIGRRIGGSRAAGFWAAVFFTLNTSTAQPLGWACVYNEVLCAFFLLLALYALARQSEAADRRTLRRFRMLEWGAFLAGFGALELNAVYPALAAGYALLCARKGLRRTLPMFAVSAVYAAVHMAVAPVPRTGPYAMHWGISILRTLGTYWTWTVGPVYGRLVPRLADWMLPAGIAALSLALAWFAARKVRAAQAAGVVFCALWYLVTFAPLLPLRDHMAEYYPYIPAIGICWLGGWAFAEAWAAPRWTPRVLATAAAAVYAILMVPQLEASQRWNYALTERARSLVEGLAGAHQRHPGQTILLYGVDRDLFWNAVRDRPFRLLGMANVYLAEGTERSGGGQDWGDARDFILPGGVAAEAARRGQLAVYDVRGPRLRNITSQFAALPHDARLPERIEMGDRLTGYLLGPEWPKLEGDHRWMPRRASLRMAAPSSAGRSLYLRGNCTEEQLREGPLTLTVTVNGMPLPAVPIAATSFEAAVPLPAAVIGQAEMRVLLEVNRTFWPPGENRGLGLAFGTIALR